MNVYGGSPYCYFHPKELVVGICALCLRERLLVLASKQGNHNNVAREPNHRTNTLKGIHQRKLSNPLPKVFALASFLHRFEFRHRASNDSDQDTSTSREDSFISIKFEVNGRASWDNGTNSKQQIDLFDLPNCDLKSGKEVKGTGTVTMVATNKSVVEHVKARTMLRWQKRIGHLFQVMRLKRSSKGSTSHVACNMEGVKGRKGWIRSLTRRNME